MDEWTQQLIAQIEQAGFRVSLVHLKGSLLGTVQPCVEAHAVHLQSGEQFIAKADDEKTAIRTLLQSVRNVGRDLR